MSEMEELSKLIDVGELSRDFGLDITVSDGGLVTSALNQRQYRAECGKLYQQFMLSMADYIFEEAQLKKRLQNLMTQKKQPNIGKTADNNESQAQAAKAPETAGGNDEDAFTPAQMDEFRRLANSRNSNRSPSKAGMVGVGVGVVGPLGHADHHHRLPTSASFRAPSAMGGARAETLHIFPALKERPLTSMSRGRPESRLGSASTSINRQQATLASAANMYGGRDQEYDGVMDPTADFSVNRRMRMNPCAFSRLSSASRIKVKVMDKAGEFVMKPVAGKPGVVSINGKQDLEDGESNMMKDSRDKMALVKTKTSFKSPTLSSELKTNNLVAIQKSLLGQETKRMTVGEVMAKSRDRRARLFRVQMSTGRLDDWDVPGEDRTGRTPSRAASAGGRSLQRGGPSRLGCSTPTPVPTASPHPHPRHPHPPPQSPGPQTAKSVVDMVHHRSRADSPSGRTMMMRGRSERESESGHLADVEDEDEEEAYGVLRSRAKTAPPVRSNRRSTSTPIPEGGSDDDDDDIADEGLRVPSRRSAARSSSPYKRRGAKSGGGGDGGASADAGGVGGGSRSSRLEVPTMRSSARSPSPSSRSRSGGGGGRRRGASAVSSTTMSARRTGPATPRHAPTLSVVQLELKHDSASTTTAGGGGGGVAATANNGYESVPAPPATPGPSRRAGHDTPRSSRPRASSNVSRAMFPVSAKSLESHAHGGGKASRHAGGGGGRSAKEMRKSEDTAEKDCSVQIRHIHTLRDSAAVVRRWKDMDRDREDKLNKWRMRMSFAATRRGNLGKMLSKV